MIFRQQMEILAGAVVKALTTVKSGLALTDRAGPKRNWNSIAEPLV
jgi:hypothetical protein